VEIAQAKRIARNGLTLWWKAGMPERRPSGAKAQELLTGVAARLKSCPFKAALSFGADSRIFQSELGCHYERDLDEPEFV
jgi:hypothetical protein